MYHYSRRYKPPPLRYNRVQYTLRSTLDPTHTHTHTHTHIHKYTHTHTHTHTERERHGVMDLETPRGTREQSLTVHYGLRFTALRRVFAVLSEFPEKKRSEDRYPKVLDAFGFAVVAQWKEQPSGKWRSQVHSLAAAFSLDTLTPRPYGPTASTCVVTQQASFHPAVSVY